MVESGRLDIFTPMGTGPGPPGATVSVYFNTNLVGTLHRAEVSSRSSGDTSM